ncbi:MAG: RNA polymerase sigma factor [Oscillospiraceae bacterium]
MDFDEIYRTHAALVYRYLFSLSQDPDLSEELTQQTFYEAIRHPGRYRGEAALSTYLCGIAKNLLRHERQTQARRRERPLEEAEELPSPGGGEEEAVERLQRQALFQRIHELPEQQREVVYLRLSGELSFAEIGAILGRSETWARVTFYRAKCALKGDDA